MNVIWKFPLPGSGSGPVLMPEGAQCLFAREQFEQACVWALVDPDAKMVSRQFLVAETGNIAVPGGSRFLGSAMLRCGAYVLHVFEPEANR